MAQTQKQLGDVLVELGTITFEQLSAAHDEESRTGESAWKILIQQGALTEKDLIRARATQIGLPFADLSLESPTQEALETIPEEVARRQNILPLRVDGRVLVLAMAEPTNHLAIEEAKSVAGMEVAPSATYKADLARAIEDAYSALTMPNLVAAVAANGATAPPSPAASAGGFEPSAPPSAPAEAGGSFGPDDLPLLEAQPSVHEAPQAEVVEEAEKDPNLADFLMYVIESGASDLHLTTGMAPAVRVHGELHPIEGYRKLMPKDLQQLIYAILTQRQREHFEEELELDVSYQLPGLARFRVNIFQQRESLGTVMRMIPFEIKDPDSLGLPPAVKEFTNLRRGLVLVTGITGSGKSTTLAGLIDIINSNRREHIMTVEDPIEFLHKHKLSVVNQREIGTDTQSFAKALKHVLRQDPDVILVGEMRDLETISSALTAAETGHLVFGTLHTQDAPQSVDRVIDVFPPHAQQQIRVQLAGTLAGVVSQQLVPTVDGKGRAVAAEVLVATSAVRNLIREGKTHQIYTSMQAGGKHGMQVMDQALAELVKKGKITYEMGLERSHHVEEYNRLTGKG